MKKDLKVLLCLALMFSLATANSSSLAEDKVYDSNIDISDTQTYDSVSINSDIVVTNTTTGAIKTDNLTNSGTLTNNGTINGTVTGINVNIENNNTFTNSSSGVVNANDIINKGILENSGNISVENNLTNGTVGGSNVSLTNDGSINVKNTFSNLFKFINNKNINAKEINNTGDITNSASSEIKTDNLTNSGTLTNNGTMNGTVTGTNVNIENNNTFTNSSSGVVNANDIINKGILENSGNISVENNLTNGTVGGSNVSLTNDGSINVKNTFSNLFKFINNKNINAKEINNTGDIINNENSVIETESLTNSGRLTNKGTITTDLLENEKNATIVNTSVINLNNTSAYINNGEFVNSGVNAKLNLTTNDFTNNGVLRLKDGAALELDNLTNSTGVLNLENSSSLTLSNQTNSIDGTINVIGNAKNSNVVNSLKVTGGDNNFIGKLNIGNAQNQSSSLTINNVIVNNDASLNIFNGGKLLVEPSSTLNLNKGDVVNGDLFLDNGIINFDNYNLTTGGISTQSGGKQAFYEQDGGTLSLNNNSSLSMKNPTFIRGGILNIDNTSSFNALSEVSNSANVMSLNTLNSKGLFNVMNSGIGSYKIDDINVDGQSNFNIDIYARCNYGNLKATDKFEGANINGNGTINISDWTLGTDIFGWDAPIDRHIYLDNVFNYNFISPGVTLQATKKEVLTPIGWYQLNNRGGINGNFTLDLTRYNPAVFRGQVTTVAQLMNQLAISDMLFNHSMLQRSFKEEDGGVAYSGVMANRYAAINPVFAPYQYSRKDGGLWYKMYGTFETLQMSQGLSNVGNNAYGALIGADFGLKELKNGWKFMPTAYIGYNGAHQYYPNVGAYQNGGQLGFLGTWYKNDFIIAGLAYGGIYDNSISVAGRNDNTFNYFAGAATKAAYNWRLHRDWVLQPNLLLAYNYFGQQNWHSTYGQMGMMSGMLNGVNIAPGLNLIWEKETFSIYATLQYMYNINGAVGGRAGNVNLPHVYMDRGYIQYGLGFTKRFTDRFSGYFQTVFRNVGRTGVGFQLGFNLLLGK